MYNGWKCYAMLLALATAACAKSDLLTTAANQVVGTLATYGRQNEVRKAFLAISTVAFYPDGVPSDVELLPTLPPEHLTLIQQELDTQAKLLLNTVRDQRAFLSAILQRDVAAPSGQRFVVEQLNRPTAAIDDSGTIIIDVKVLQAIYRGSLVSVAGSRPWGDCEPLLSAKCQSEAMARVFRERQVFLNRSPLPAASTAEGLLNMLKSSPRSLADLESALASRMGEAMAAFGAENLAIESSKRFDDAVMFLIAHEFGHRVLSHVQRQQRGETQHILETEADRFAAIVTVLVRNSNVRPRSPTLTQLNGVVYQGGPYGLCSVDYNHKPKGFSDFFDFGYELSGFTDDSSDYPKKNERLLKSRAATTAAMAAIDSVQEELGACGGSLPEGSVESHLKQLRKRWQRTVEEKQRWAYEERGAEMKEWWMRWVTRYSDLLSESEVHDAFYREFRSRLSRPIHDQ